MSSLMSSCGGNINMEGTRYSLNTFFSDEEGQGHSKQNFSINATRLDDVSSVSNSGRHTCCNSLSSIIPVVSSFSHSSSNFFPFFSEGLMAMTFLKISISHCGSKITIFFNSGVSSKWIKLLWSCRKVSNV